jgi:hypothetical protein
VQSTELLKTKFLDKIKDQHIDLIVQRASREKANILVHECLLVLQSLFDREKIISNVQEINGEKMIRKTFQSNFLSSLDSALSCNLFSEGLVVKK